MKRVFSAQWQWTRTSAKEASINDDIIPYSEFSHEKICDARCPGIVFKGSLSCSYDKSKYQMMPQEHRNDNVSS